MTVVKERRRGLHIGDLIVLSLVGGGLIAILLTIIIGLFYSKRAGELPNWAENVLVSISTAAALKLGDVLASLVALANGRQVENLGNQLASSAPQPKPPIATDVKEAAQDVADSAEQRAGDYASAPTAREPLDLTGAELPGQTKGP